MKIGILADIHECVIHLRSALQAFRENGVDQVVVLGDIFETGKYIDETVQLLRDVNAFGVWGNHDVGLSHEPDPPNHLSIWHSCRRILLIPLCAL